MHCSKHTSVCKVSQLNVRHVQRTVVAVFFQLRQSLCIAKHNFTRVGVVCKPPRRKEYLPQPAFFCRRPLKQNISFVIFLFCLLTNLVLCYKISLQPEFNTFCKGILYLGKDVLIRNQTNPLQDVLLFGVATTRMGTLQVLFRESNTFFCCDAAFSAGKRAGRANDFM